MKTQNRFTCQSCNVKDMTHDQAMNHLGHDYRDPEYAHYIKSMEFQGFVPMTYDQWAEAKERDYDLRDSQSLWVD